jgi:hypothetical protein
MSAARVRQWAFVDAVDGAVVFGRDNIEGLPKPLDQGVWDLCRRSERPQATPSSKSSAHAAHT